MALLMMMMDGWRLMISKAARTFLGKTANFSEDEDNEDEDKDDR